MILDLPLSLMLNFRKVKEKTNDLQKVVEAVKSELQNNKNCNFECNEDFSRIRKKNAVIN